MDSKIQLFSFLQELFVILFKFFNPLLLLSVQDGQPLTVNDFRLLLRQDLFCLIFDFLKPFANLLFLRLHCFFYITKAYYWLRTDHLPFSADLSSRPISYQTICGMLQKHPLSYSSHYVSSAESSRQVHLRLSRTHYHKHDQSSPSLCHNRLLAYLDTITVIFFYCWPNFFIVNIDYVLFCLSCLASFFNDHFLVWYPHIRCYLVVFLVNLIVRLLYWLIDYRSFASLIQYSWYPPLLFSHHSEQTFFSIFAGFLSLSHYFFPVLPFTMWLSGFLCLSGSPTITAGMVHEAVVWGVGGCSHLP